MTFQLVAHHRVLNVIGGICELYNVLALFLEIIDISKKVMLAGTARCVLLFYRRNNNGRRTERWGMSHEVSWSNELTISVCSLLDK